MGSGDAATRARLRLFAGLQQRRAEIEDAVLARVRAIEDPIDVEDPEYAENFAGAVSAAIGYGLSGVGTGEHSPPPIPVQALTQVRLAARDGVSLSTVLRRYLAGTLTVVDIVLDQAEAESILADLDLVRLLRAASPLLDRLLESVAEEYEREARFSSARGTDRRAELVLRALNGERIDPAQLPYSFDGFHLAAVVEGREGPEVLKGLASALGRRLLSIDRGRDVRWFWLGGRRSFGDVEIEQLCSSVVRGVVIAWGEPGSGSAGWRLSHQQAKASFPVALHAARGCVRYSEVALLAAMLQDSVLASSMRQIYLDPLDEGGDSGDQLRQALRAYIAADRNVSSAAAALKVNRKTVANRLAAAEAKLGRPLSSCVAEVEAALTMEDFEAARSTDRVGRGENGAR